MGLAITLNAFVDREYGKAFPIGQLPVRFPSRPESTDFNRGRPSFRFSVPRFFAFDKRGIPRAATIEDSLAYHRDDESFSESTMASAGLPEGTRYHSSDGRTVLVLSMNGFQLFRVTGPYSHVALTRRVDLPDRALLTAAINADGTRIALQYLPGRADGTRRVTEVTLWDRRLRESPPLTKTTAYGLQFYGRFLLVGSQRHPIPAYLVVMETEELLLYDCSELR